MEEAIETITDEAFRALASRPRYLHDGIERLQQHVRQFHQHADAVVTRDDVVVTSADAKHMTAPQWTTVQEIQTTLPGATVTLRTHHVTWKRDSKIALAPIFGVLVTQRGGPFTLRREYVAP
jgi:predicted phosphohydrolase